MEIAERLERYFKELDSRLNIRIQRPFPMNFRESGEIRESDTYGVFFDKNDGTTNLVEVVHYRDDRKFNVMTNDVKEVESIDQVIVILDKFFIKPQLI